MINWVIGNFDLNESDKIFIIVKKGDEIEKLRDEWFKKIPLNINFVVLDSPTEGPADTVNKVRDQLDPEMPLIVANSDQYVDENLNEFVTSICSATSVGCILTMEAAGSKWSYVSRSIDGFVQKVVEKIEISDEATVGIYGWHKAKHFFNSFDRMVGENDRTNNEFYVAPTYNYLIEQGYLVSAENIGKVEQKIFGLGTPEDLDIFLNTEKFLPIANTLKISLR